MYAFLRLALLNTMSRQSAESFLADYRKYYQLLQLVSAIFAAFAFGANFDILELLFLVEGLVLLVKLLGFLSFWHESSFRTQFIVIDKLITIIMNDTHISYRKPSSFRRTNNPLSSCNKPFWIFKNNLFFILFFLDFWFRGFFKLKTITVHFAFPPALL